MSTKIRKPEYMDAALPKARHWFLSLPLPRLLLVVHH